jgi:DNA polymerase-1
MQSLGVDTLVKDKVTGKMKDSVDKKVLASQKGKNPIIATYIEYTEHQKTVSTYGENWFEYINPVTRRIHSNYQQIMNTGRLSSGQRGDKKKNLPQLPNMQNIPSDKRTRSCFQAREGYDLIVSDYSGQEQIVLANKSLDPDLLYFYSQGLGDMHSFVASKIFPELNGLPLDDIKNNHKQKRQIAKGAGFAINYGGTGITIAQNLNVSMEKGEEVYQAYFKAFPGLADYFKEEKQKALKLGYIEFNGVSNRKCFIPYFDDFRRLHGEIYDTDGFWEDYKQEKNKNSEKFREYYKPKVREYFVKKGDIERMSLNYPIQGSSADITKLAGIYFFRYLIENNLLFKVYMSNVVHDEWIVECPEDMSETIKSKLKSCMEDAGDVFCKTIKLKADPVITKFWEH